ncbi:MAG: sulfite exporter TauE/SafE family protein [Clostridiales bacterium]|nr:sulfite exporter TauE/SafE family protein [Clostridiales bacterium]
MTEVKRSGTEVHCGLAGSDPSRSENPSHIATHKADIIHVKTCIRKGDAMEQVLIVVFSSFCGGLVQAVTGFGGAVIIMIFLPLILNMTAAPALSDVITMTLSFSMFWRYRKSVRFKSIVIPAAVYLIASTLAIHGSAFIDAGKLKGVFGVFLIILSVYFFGFSGKLSVKPTLFMKFGCGALAGICGGLFGISGPPVSLFYLAATDTKEEYLGTLNAFFSFTVIFNLISRIYNGFLTISLVPLMGVGIAAILTGCVLGSRIVKKINIDVMRKCVYGFMAFAGMVIVVQGILR